MTTGSDGASPEPLASIAPEAATPQRLRLGFSIVDYGIVIAFVLLCVALAILTPTFMTSGNILNVGRQVSIVAILAAGQTFVILTAGIDLSVGSVLAVSGAVAAGVAAAFGWGPGILAGLLVGASAGLFNGLVITLLRVPDFVATLAMLSIARGATLIYTGGEPIGVAEGGLRFLGAGTIGPIPVPIVVMLIVFAVSIVVLRSTTIGRYVYATGGNRRAAAFSGIDINRVRVLVYVVSGLLAGLAGVVLTGRLATADPQAGVGYELDSIAAVVLGGTSLFGGQGTVARTLLGALILGVLSNGMNLLDVSPFYQEVVKGIVIVIAVAFGNLEQLRHRVLGA
jgi:ribose/xylose/arabinose/galactoside ABC-type transport system permease subunit